MAEIAAQDRVGIVDIGKRIELGRRAESEKDAELKDDDCGKDDCGKDNDDRPS